MVNKLKYLIFGISLIFFLSLVSATQVCEVYDDFSLGVLNTSKWEIRQDYEGQPLITDSKLDTDLQNFHTSQNSILGDHRTYLVPTHKFKAGDILEFNINFISASGNSVTMLLIDNQHRIGLGGCWDGICQPFQTYHIKLEFKEGSIKITHNLWNDEVVINSNSEHEIYIGTVFGHNGMGHIDYDNFELCTEVEGNPNGNNDLEERIIALEEKVEGLENRTILLESIVSELKDAFDNFVNKITTFIERLPKGLRRHWN